MMQLDSRINLVICQKSKVSDWIEHFKTHYKDKVTVYDLTTKKSYAKLCTKGALENAINQCYPPIPYIFIINYELAFRRPQLKQLKDFTLMLDESSLIQNETAKRSKFILSLRPKNVILLSGTPTSGKYENLYSQLKLLGWPIRKDLYWKHFIETEYIENMGFPLRIVTGYKNVDRLKAKLRKHGAIFMKSDEVFDLPEQVFNTVSVPTTIEYRKFKKDKLVTIEGKELVGDTTLTKILYQRMLCGMYNADKLQAFADLVESTGDRLIVFYNFNEELDKMCEIAYNLNRPMSFMNGQDKDLHHYYNIDNSITFCQYMAASMGHNFQLANKIIYFTPPLSSELFEQSKARIRRIGQERTCFYYKLVCKNSIEEHIYEVLDERRDYTDALFLESEK